ncbi:MAG: hypothetical protein JKY56_17870 [Kofleriaceae bacterium]|nr:hypothetical protein [Kofleriaceae bacterium]
MTRLLLLPCLFLYACGEPPERACDRVRFGWPNFLIEPSQDQSDAEGIQVSFAVASDLLPDIEVNLLVAQGDEDRVVVGSGISQEDGGISFTDISVPQGSIVFFVEARDECGVHRSGKRTYVWDGLGFPQCKLSLSAGPDESSGSGLPVLTSEHDLDENQPGFQTRIRVEAGRSDMEVRLFVLDQESGESQDFILPTQSDGTITQVVTLAPGEQAMRAVCIWETENLRPSTPTFSYIVE